MNSAYKLAELVTQLDFFALILCMESPLFALTPECDSGLLPLKRGCFRFKLCENICYSKGQSSGIGMFSNPLLSFNSLSNF